MESDKMITNPRVCIAIAAWQQRDPLHKLYSGVNAPCDLSAWSLSGITINNPTNSSVQATLDTINAPLETLRLYLDLDPLPEVMPQPLDISNVIDFNSSVDTSVPIISRTSIKLLKWFYRPELVACSFPSSVPCQRLLLWRNDQSTNSMDDLSCMIGTLQRSSPTFLYLNEDDFVCLSDALVARSVKVCFVDQLSVEKPVFRALCKRIHRLFPELCWLHTSLEDRPLTRFASYCSVGLRRPQLFEYKDLAEEAAYLTQYKRGSNLYSALTAFTSFVIACALAQLEVPDPIMACMLRAVLLYPCDQVEGKKMKRSRWKVSVV
eukprot:TRINITY_DN4281_c0_g1_i1.p2 TRINITY_DN4281_c0_g1~~TRINITY_DN4281_c0_g1_i1.p2  ORF type:complete len:321 (+),score=27.12 TRINITY_DN4281_c0_g1_i1:2469-3431(+)